MAKGPIIRTSTHGYVVENFLGECKTTGNMYPVITRGGKPAIFPDRESIPPKWRKYARPASVVEVASGTYMERVINVLHEYDESGRLVKSEQAIDPYIDI